MRKSGYLLAVVLAGVTVAAHATPLGTIDFSGTAFEYDTKGPEAGDLKFGGSATIDGATSGTGALADADGNLPNYGYISGGNNRFVTIPPGGKYDPTVTSFPELLFTITNGLGSHNPSLETFTFDAVGFQGTPGTGTITIFGYLTESFGNGSPSLTDEYAFILTPSANDQNAYVGYTATLVPYDFAPEPSSLMLLGTGVLGLAVVVRRRIAL